MRNFIGLSVLVLLSAACTQSQFDPGSEDAGDSGTGHVNGGGDGGTPEASVPPGCDATKLPSDDFCVVNDGEGVFASTSLGAGTNDGTQAHPLGSLDAAITLAKKENKKRVYACAEIYAEQIHIQDGISVFGNLSCNGGLWALSTGHAKVSAPASPAASATNVTSATRIEAVDIFAPDFTDKSQSSIGLIATTAPGLHIVNATIHAGKGGKGNDGTDATAPIDSGNAKNGGNGEGAHLCSGMLCIGNTGAVGGTNACTGAKSTPAPGGFGGSGGEFQYDNSKFNPVSGYPTSAGNPTSGSTQVAQGGGISQGGTSGAAGAAGVDGAPGSNVGTFSATGYAAADGTVGTDGAPGQSGGGAGGMFIQDVLPQWTTVQTNQYAWSESGAGGGAGGCGGIAATIGNGGGASVAIVAIQSALVLDQVKIETSAAGDGGAAGRPSALTLGGTGGYPFQAGKNGGNGGPGGRAGVSGNGAGGPSIGIAYQGTKPQLLATTTTVGASGHGVALRSYTDGTLIPASPDGVSANDYAF